MTSTASEPLRLALFTACSPTAIGSVSAALLAGVPAGTVSTNAVDNTMYSAKPPGTSVE